MDNPYKILGVSPQASDEEVKAAYRELAKKYHPDNYVNNPLSGLASEKMQEINDAYDSIINMRRNAQQQHSAGGNSSYTGQGTPRYAEIRRLLQAQKVVEAEQLLDAMDNGSRDAEWYFLKGSVYHKRGWLDEALNHFQRACEMNPGNPEYKAAYQQLLWQKKGNMNGNPYRTMPNQQTGCSACDMCSSLICADCCCECMGGDLISCC